MSANRILIDTGTLRDLLDKHPQVEIDIMAVAVEKIAEEWKRKLTTGKLDKLVNGAVEKIDAQIVSAYSSRGLTEPVKKMIREAIFDVLNDQTKAVAAATARTAAAELIAEAKKSLEAEMKLFAQSQLAAMDVLIQSSIERQVIATMRTLSTISKPAGE